MTSEPPPTELVSRAPGKLWYDAIAVIALLCVITAGWCYTNSKWNRASWDVPAVYLGPYQGAPKSDVLFYFGVIRAARDGHFTPMCSKIVPELGAPYEAAWNDWPIVEELPFYTMGLVARLFGIFAALNITLLSCHLLAGLTFYLVSRYQRVCIAWSFTAALAFGLCSYIFSESPDHVSVALCWHVPLFLLVWNWVASEREIQPGSKRFYFGIFVALLAGLQNPYYAGIFCQLVLLGGAALSIRLRSWRHLIAPVSFVGTTLFAFVLMNVDTWVYRFKFGPNPGALVREYKWLEIYGLKLVDLVVPPLNHHCEAFRRFAQWRAQNQILHDEGSYFGIVGIAALLLLAYAAIRALNQNDSRRVPTAAWQVLWIFLFFTTGGLNAIGGLLGFRFFRTGCRLSVVILAIALLFAAQILTQRLWRRPFVILAAILCCFIIIVDQVPSPASPDERAVVAAQISSDQQFVKNLESILPKGALVFQIPVMDFPEAPLRDVSAYDHLRPYLYSHQLRFSFGSMKGRPREQWQPDLLGLSLPDVIVELKRRGFSALYVNRNAYPEKAREMEQSLRALGFDRVIENAGGDLFCVAIDTALP